MSEPGRFTGKRCLAHPGRPIVCPCRGCKRMLCRACLYEASPFCSAYCRNRFLGLPQASPERLLFWFLLALSALGLLVIAAMLLMD